MQIELHHRPAHTLAAVSLEPGESITAESGAMVAMDPTLEMETSAGGLMKGLKRLFGGESFFRNTFRAAHRPGRVLLAPTLSGDMEVLEVEAGRGLYLQSTAFVASSPGVELNTRLGGFKTFFAGEGLFVLQATGRGSVLVGAYGALEKVTVDGSYVIDTGHLVAWDESLEFSVGKSSDGWVSSFLSGEGLACHFRGRGQVWLQTRNPSAYGQALGRLLPPREQ
jgi:uncharacterized protein (TIGR00266 family)